MRKRASLLPIVRKFFDTDPVAAAHSLETMEGQEAVEVLRGLPPALSAKAFPHLQVGHAVALLREVPEELFREIVQKLEPSQGAMILAQVPAEVRQSMLEHLPEATRRQIQELLVYPESSAGRIMSTDFLAFHEEVMVKEVIQRIRSLGHRRTPPSYAYVVDLHNHLVGVINMWDLLMASPASPVGEVMRKEVFSVSGFMDREQVANELAKRNFFAAPVVDHENRLAGVVKTEQLLGHVQEEATEDLQRMVGAGADERPFSPIPFSLRMRLPWLQVNLATAFLAAWVVSLFQDAIARMTVLAVFLPVVAGQGGNAGAQSLAVVIRGLAMREIPPDKARALVFKETAVGLANGLVTGVVVAAVAWIWQGNLYLGLVIGLAMVVNLVAAGLSGAAIPLLLKALGRDPAQASSIILTTVTDVVGFAAFLGFAVLFERFLRGG